MVRRDFRFGISGGVSGLDVGEYLIRHPSSTYFMRLDEDILDLDLHRNDIIIVDRSLNPRSNDLVIIQRTDDPSLRLVRFSEVGEDSQLWGVITSMIRDIRS